MKKKNNLSWLDATKLVLNTIDEAMCQTQILQKISDLGLKDTRVPNSGELVMRTLLTNSTGKNPLFTKVEDQKFIINPSHKSVLYNHGVSHLVKRQLPQRKKSKAIADDFVDSDSLVHENEEKISYSPYTVQSIDHLRKNKRMRTRPVITPKTQPVTKLGILLKESLNTSAQPSTKSRELVQDMLNGNSDIMKYDNIVKKCISMEEFMGLTKCQQRYLASHLPPSDVRRERKTMRLLPSALSNPFFAAFFREWQDRLGKGELSTEFNNKVKLELDKQVAKHPWKASFFEDVWGFNHSQITKELKNRRNDTFDTFEDSIKDALTSIPPTFLIPPVPVIDPILESLTPPTSDGSEHDRTHITSDLIDQHTTPIKISDDNKSLHILTPDHEIDHSEKLSSYLSPPEDIQQIRTISEISESVPIEDNRSDHLMDIIIHVPPQDVLDNKCDMDISEPAQSSTGGIVELSPQVLPSSGGMEFGNDAEKPPEAPSLHNNVSIAALCDTKTVSNLVSEELSHDDSFTENHIEGETQKDLLPVSDSRESPNHRDSKHMESSTLPESPNNKDSPIHLESPNHPESVILSESSTLPESKSSKDSPIHLESPKHPESVVLSESSTLPESPNNPESPIHLESPKHAESHRYPESLNQPESPKSKESLIHVESHKLEESPKHRDSPKHIESPKYQELSIHTNDKDVLEFSKKDDLEISKNYILESANKKLIGSSDKEMLGNCSRKPLQLFKREFLAPKNDSREFYKKETIECSNKKLLESSNNQLKESSNDVPEDFTESVSGLAFHSCKSPEKMHINLNLPINPGSPVVKESSHAPPVLKEPYPLKNSDIPSKPVSYYESDELSFPELDLDDHQVLSDFGDKVGSCTPVIEDPDFMCDFILDKTIQVMPEKPMIPSSPEKLPLLEEPSPQISHEEAPKKVTKLTVADDISLNIMNEIKEEFIAPAKLQLTETLKNECLNGVRSPLSAYDSSTSSTSSSPRTDPEKRERLTLKIRTKDLILPSDTTPYPLKHKKPKRHKSKERVFKSPKTPLELNTHLQQVYPSHSFNIKNGTPYGLYKQTIESEEDANLNRISLQQQLLAEKGIKSSTPVVQPNKNYLLLKNMREKQHCQQLPKLTRAPTHQEEEKPANQGPMVVLDSGSQKYVQQSPSPKSIPVIKDTVSKQLFKQPRPKHPINRSDSSESIRSALKAKINQRRFTDMPHINLDQPPPQYTPLSSGNHCCYVAKGSAGECVCSTAPMLFCTKCYHLSHSSCSNVLCSNCGALFKFN